MNQPKIYKYSELIMNYYVHREAADSQVCDQAFPAYFDRFYRKILFAVFVQALV